MTEFEAFVILGLCDGYGYEADLAAVNHNDCLRVAATVHGDDGLFARGLIEYVNGIAVPTVEACAEAMAVEAATPNCVLVVV